MKRIAATCLLFLFLAGAGNASAQEGDDPADLSFDDWVMQCEPLPADKGRCFITQSIHIKQSGQRLTQLAMGYPYEDGQLVLLITGPLGMYLPSGFILAPDDIQEYKAEIQYCNQEGCHAFLQVQEKLRNQMRKGRWLNIRMKDGTRREIRFQASLNGLTAGLNAVTERLEAGDPPAE